MGNTEYVDKLVAEGFFDDVERLKKELPLLAASMEQLSKAGRDVNAALGSTKTLKEMVDTTSRAADVNTKVATTVNVMATAYKAADEIIAKHNGHSKEFITVSKGVADVTLKEAKAATENAKQKEIEAKYTAALTREKEKLDKAAAKEEANLKKQQSAYYQLNEEYKKAAALAQDLGAKQFMLQQAVAGGNNVQVNNTELARLGPQLADAQAQALKLHTALLSVDQAVGKSQRNVGNYNSAQFAMSQLLREAPSFAYSFSTGLLALSNNIPILVDEINKMKVANEALKASGGATIPIWKTLMGAITSPVGLITIATAAITIMAARWDGASESMSEAEKSAQKLKDTLKDLQATASETYASELAKSNELFATAENLGLSYNARVDAINKLLQIYPELLASLDQEAFLNGKVADKQDIISSIISKRAYIKYYEDLAKSIAKSREELEKQFSEQNKSGGFYNPFSASGTVADMNNQQAQIKKLNDEIADAKYNADILKRELQFLMNPKDTHTGRILSDIDADIKRQESIRDTTVAEEAAHKKSIARLKELQEERRKYLGDEEKRKKEEFKIDYDNLINQKNYVVLAQTREQYEAEVEAAYQKRMAVTKDIEQALQDQRTGSLNELNEQHKKGAISFEIYTKSKEDMDKRFVYTSLILHKAYYEELLKEYPGDERLQALISKANKDLAELYAADAKNYADAQKKKQKEAEDTHKAMRDLVREAVQQSIATNAAFVDGYYQKQIDAQQRILDGINERKNAEIDAINLSMESEDKKQKRIQALNAQTAQQEKQLQAEMRRLKREQAIADRIAGVLRVVENTAGGVTRAMHDYKWPFSLIPAGIVAGIGAAQVAAIFAQPLPQYGEGTPKDKVGHPGGPAIIGDKPEWVMEPGKAPYFTSSTHIRNLPRFTRVIPEKDMVAGSMGFLTPQLMQSIYGGGNDMGGIEKKLEENAQMIASAIKNKPETTFIASNGEFKKIVRRGNSYIEYLNDNFN